MKKRLSIFLGSVITTAPLLSLIACNSSSNYSDHNKLIQEVRSHVLTKVHPKQWIIEDKGDITGSDKYDEALELFIHRVIQMEGFQDLSKITIKDAQLQDALKGMKEGNALQTEANKAYRFSLNSGIKYTADKKLTTAQENMLINFDPKIKGTDEEKTIFSLIKELKDPKITSIGDKALEDSTLIRLELPNVTTIGDNAFVNASLFSLDMPKVTTIGESAFATSPLKSLNIPLVKKIATLAFFHADLKSLDLPELKETTSFTFKNSPLTHLDISSLTKIGDRDFSGIKHNHDTTVIISPTLKTLLDKNDATTKDMFEAAFGKGWEVMDIKKK